MRYMFYDINKGKSMIALGSRYFKDISVWDGKLFNYISFVMYHLLLSLSNTI